MSCFVFVVLAGGLGFLSFLGVVLACPSCFLGLLGFSVFLVRSAPACWGWGRVAGGSGVRGLARPGGLLPFCWGVGLGCVCARPVVLLVVWFWLWSGPVVGGGCVRVARFPWWGSGCARFLLLLVVVGVFGCCFFPSGASRVLLVSGVGLRGLAGGRGVVGGVGLGSGLFFLRLLLYWPGLVSGFLRGGWFGFGLGFVWRV